MDIKFFFLYCREIIKIAVPILSVRVFYIAIGFIGMIIIAHLGANELAAGALVTAFTNTIIVIAMSPLLAISILISRYFGEHKSQDIGKVLRQGWLVSLVIGIIASVILWYIADLFKYLGQSLELVPLAKGYFHGMAWGIVPSFILASCHQFFFPLRKGMIVVYLSTINFILTLLLGIGLIFGYGGLPKLGMAGWAYSISIVNWLLLLGVLLYLYSKKDYKIFDIFNFRGKVDLESLKQFFQISLPITMQFSSELIAFSALNIMVGWLGIAALSVQQILIQCSTVVLMVPMGVGQACTILISYYMGNDGREKVRSICLSGLTLVAFITLIIAVIYYVFPAKIIALYVPLNSLNPSLLYLATLMLGIVAFNQIADAVRNVTIAALRGLRDIWYPMWVNMILLWLVALPTGYILAFIFKTGIIGLNVGFLIAFILGALLMVARFMQKTALFSKNSLMGDKTTEMLQSS